MCNIIRIDGFMAQQIKSKSEKLKTLLAIVSLIFSMSVNAQTLQSGNYSSTDGGYAKTIAVEVSANSIKTTDGGYVSKYVQHGSQYIFNNLAQGNGYIYYINVTSNSQFVLTNNKSQARYVFTYTGGRTATVSNCDCEKDVTAQKYFEMAQQDLNAHTCAYCAELARWQCLYECGNSAYSPSQIQEKITYYENVLRNYQNQTVTNATTTGGLATQKNTICCAELVGKKLQGATALSPNTTNGAAESQLDQQYSTLLESLTTNGTITESNAKAYLEALFGYDENVSNYLTGVNLANQINNISSGTLSTEQFMTSLSNSLVSVMPPQQQQMYHAQMLGTQIGSELRNGQLSANSVNELTNMATDLAVGIGQGIQENTERKQREAVIKQKIETITPTLDKLNSATKEYAKLKITDEVESDKNWVTNSNPPVLWQESYQTQGNMLTITTVTTNHVANTSRLQNGTLVIDMKNFFYESPFIGDDIRTKYEAWSFYKNPEKFDFSKDFKMNLYIKYNTEQGRLNKIIIGKGYHLSIMDIGNYFYVATADKYAVTTKYGELVENNKEITKEKQVDKAKGVYVMANKMWGRYIALDKRKHNLGDVIKLTVTKKGNVFTCSVNDIAEISSEIQYFPDKYYLGFLLNPPFKYELSKKGAETIRNSSYSLEIHKLELEHL